MRSGQASLSLLLLAACSANFTPASLVTGLQVLGIKAEPPDIRPGDTTALTILVVDPAQQTPAMTTVFIGCDPDPTGLIASSCSQYENLQDPTEVLALSDDGGLLNLPGAHLLGFDQSALYSAPAGLFDSLASDDLNRTAGVLADVLSITVAEVVPIPPTAEQVQGLIQRLKSKQTPYALALKQIRVAQLGPLNQNPELGMVYTPTQVIGPGFGLDLTAGESLVLSAVTPVGADETYVSIGPDGNMETRTESAIYSWFASTGAMSSPRSTYGSPTQTFAAPTGSSIPGSRTFSLWVVVRDERGGIDWGTYPGFVCDPSRPPPVITGSSFDDPAQPTQLALSGQNLSEILDASIAGLPVAGEYNVVLDAWVGVVPPGPASPVQLEVRATNCSTLQVSLIHP